MRNYFPHGAPLDHLADGGEFPDAGLCVPDDPLDKVLNYVYALDDGFSFLEALGIEPDYYGCQGAVASANNPDEVGAGAVVPGENRAAPCLSGGFPELAPPPPATANVGFDAGSALVGGNTSARALCGGVPELAPPPTMATMTLALSSYSSSTVSSTTSSCISSGESESPDHASPFVTAWTVPRRRRRMPAAVRKRPWPLAFSDALFPADGSRRFAAPPPMNQQGKAPRTCTHCMSWETPQWRTGPKGPGTLCNACGLRYGMGKLYAEYRPSTSPFFRSGEHSNRHRKVEKLREKKLSAMASTGGAGDDEAVTDQALMMPPACKYIS